MIELPESYPEWLQTLRAKISQAHSAAAVAVNQEMVLVYGDIGTAILEKQNNEGWGARVIDRLSSDLVSSFPGTKGFSPRNLKYMRAFAEAWPDRLIVQEALAQLPWYQNLALIEKLDQPETRLWYANEASAHGWSRSILVHQIETELHKRQGTAISNFSSTMPAERSKLAERLFKDPYLVDFIDLPPDAHERHLETALVDRIRHFLLELGKGFAFLGNQYRLDAGGKEFYLDLLFYHTKLHCHVVIDLKMGDFEPEFVGKMNF